MPYVFEDNAAVDQSRFVFEDQPKEPGISDIVKQKVSEGYDKLVGTIKSLGPEFEKFGERSFEAAPTIPVGIGEVAAHLGTMTYGIPLAGFGEIIDLATGGKFHVGKKIADATIYQPQTKGGELVRDILFSPAVALSAVGKQRAENLQDELLKEYGPDDIRTTLYPTIRQVFYDILGIGVAGKGIHGVVKPIRAAVDTATGPKGQPVSEAAYPLDNTFAKDEIVTRTAKERAATAQRPLEKVAREEESLKAEREAAAREAEHTEPFTKIQETEFDKLTPEEQTRLMERRFREKQGVPQKVEGGEPIPEESRYPDTEATLKKGHAVAIRNAPAVKAEYGVNENIYPKVVEPERQLMGPRGEGDRFVFEDQVPREEAIADLESRVKAKRELAPEAPTPEPELKPIEKQKATSKPVLMVKTKDGTVYGVFAKKGRTHLDVLTKYKLKPEDIADTGMRTDKGENIWGGGKEIKGKPEFDFETSKLKPSGLSVDATLFNTDPAKFDGYAWRMMSKNEYEKLMAGQMKYGGKSAKKGNFLAPTPESAAQYKKKGKYLVEFGGVTKAEGETVSNILGKNNVTDAKVWDGTAWIKPGQKFSKKPLPPIVSQKNANNAKTFRAWVRAKGGVKKDDIVLRGEIKDESKGARWQPAVVSGKGRPSDELIALAKEEGWEIRDVDDFIDALANNRDRGAASKTDQWIEKQIKEELRRHEEEIDGTEVEGIKREIDKAGKEEALSEIKKDYTEEQLSTFEGLLDKEPWDLKPEEGTQWEKAAKLADEGIIKWPEKSGKKGVFKGDEAIDRVSGTQKPMFEGLKEQEQKDMFGTASEQPRTIKDVAKDLSTVIGEKGALTLDPKKFTPEQQAAVVRLQGDLKHIKTRAEKVGKTVEQYLLDRKVDPQVAYLIHKYADELPKYARSINLEKQDIPEDYKAFEASLLSSKPKKTQTWEQSEKLAQKYMDDIEKQASLFKRAKKGQLPLTTEKLLAMRTVNVNAIEGLKKVIETQDPEAARAALDSYRDNIGHVISDASSEVGRMLNIHKKEVSITHLGHALTNLKKSLTKIQFEELKRLNLGDPVQIQNFIKNLKDPTLSNYFMEYWYNMILSGPPTHVVNAVGNTLWLSFQVPHRAVTAVVDNLYSHLTGKERQFYMNEILPMLSGYKSGFLRGRKVASEVIRTGQAQRFEDKWFQELDFSLGAWRRSPNETVRKIAPYVDAPTRALRAMDVWANSMAYDGEMRSIARRQSNAKGLKGRARTEFERNLIENPTDEMHEAAMKKALNSTFMDEPDPFTKYIIQARNIPVVGPALRVTIMPFVNTISNLTKRGIEMTPGLGVGKELVSRGMERGMPTPELVAKQVEGTIIALYVVGKAAEGRITGPMPENKAKREAWYRQNKKPWAINLTGKYNEKTGELEGGTWIEYRRLEPYNTVVASAAIAYDKIKGYMEVGNEKSATEVFGEFADQLKMNLLDGSYLSGLQQVFNRYGGRKGIVPRWLSSWMPYSSFFRSINRSVEVMLEGEARPREGNEWLKAFSAVIPVLSGKAPSKLDVWGKESVIPGGVFQQWLPFKWAKVTDDPVETKLARLNDDLEKIGLRGIYPSPPHQTVKYRGKEIELPDDVYRKYAIDYGAILKKHFEWKMNSGGWDRRPPEQRVKILSKLRSKASRSARARLIRNYLSNMEQKNEN